MTTSATLVQCNARTRARLSLAPNRPAKIGRADGVWIVLLGAGGPAGRDRFIAVTRGTDFTGFGHRPTDVRCGSDSAIAHCPVGMLHSSPSRDEGRSDPSFETRMIQDLRHRSLRESGRCAAPCLLSVRRRWVHRDPGWGAPTLEVGLQSVVPNRTPALGVETLQHVTVRAHD